MDPTTAIVLAFIIVLLAFLDEVLTLIAVIMGIAAMLFATLAAFCVKVYQLLSGEDLP